MEADETALPALDALDDLPPAALWPGTGLCVLPFATAGSAPAETTVRLCGGLKDEVIQMVREGRMLTLAMKITNESKDADAFTLLYGEPPAISSPA